MNIRFTFPLLLAGVLSLASAHAQIDYSFNRKYVLPWLQSITSMQLVDLNQDTYPDLIAASEYGDVVWLMNDGDASFAMADDPGTITLASGPATVHDLSIADFNGDQIPDVLFGNSTYGHLYWVANNGDTTFEPAALVDTFDAEITDVATADLDNDGDLDAICIAGGEVHFFTNDGTATFTPTASVIAQTGAVDVLSADLNGDSFVDLVCAFDNNIIYAYLNNGDGTFGAPYFVDFSMPDVKEIHADDLDNDGDIDLMAINEGSTYWYNNDGTGSIVFEQLVFSNSNGAGNVTSGDMDGDDYADILVSASNNSKLVYYTNEGGFFEEDHYTIDQDAPGVKLVQTADLDLDGDLDVVATTGSVLKIYLTYSFGQQFESSEYINSGGSVGGASLGHYDNDGIPDLFLASPSSSTVSVCRGTAHGEFLDRTTALIGSSWSDWEDMRVVDLDGDGLHDVLGVAGSRAHILRNTGGDLELEYSESIGAETVSVGDFDLDDDLDYAVTGSSTLVIGENLGGPGWNFNIHEIEGLGEHSFVCDFNNDGAFDIFRLENGSTNYSTINWYTLDLTTPSDPLTFQGTVLDHNFRIDEVDLLDWDQDGDQDLVFFDWEEQVFLVLNEGNGTNWTLQSWPHVGIYLEELFPKDLDQDGDLDVIAFNRSGGSRVKVFVNGGNLGVPTIQVLPTSIPFTSYDAQLSDVNGVTDLITYSGDDVVIFYGNNQVVGCTDPTACNFRADATISDDSCCYGVCGCTISSAINYTNTADCNDGSCLYDVYVTVFEDLDEDGNIDSWLGETGIGRQSVTIEHLNVTLFTDASGRGTALLPDPNGYGLSGPVSLYSDPDSAYPVFTQDNPYSSTFASMFGSNWVRIGRVLSDTVASLSVDIIPPGNDLPCDESVVYTIAYENTGNKRLSGILAIEVDSLLDGWDLLSTTDSVSGNTFYTSFTDLQRGYTQHYDLELVTPDGSGASDAISISAHLMALEEESVIAESEDVFVQPVTCQLDTLTKHSFPLGTGDDHLVSGEEYQTFTVRYSNPSFDYDTRLLIITDTLDANYDYSTFELLTSTHSVRPSLDRNSGRLVFYFYNIQLQEADNNNGSQSGFVSYRIKPLPGLPSGTRLESSATLSYHPNYTARATDPVETTNPTWITIHSCAQAPPVTASAGAVAEICPMTMPTVVLEYNPSFELDHTLTWVAGANSGSGTEITLPPVYDGDIVVTVTDPLCTSEVAIPWTQSPSDAIWFTCEGDLNCDYVVGTSDLALLLGQYNCLNEACSFELTGDNTIGADDLLVVLGHFGSSCE